MPTYEYRCKDCGHDLEVQQAFSDDPLTECPSCGGTLKKRFSSPGIAFKGSGFYKTDSRSGSKATTSGGDGAASSTSSSSDGAGKDGASSGGSSSSSGDSSSGSTSSSSSSSGTSGSGSSAAPAAASS